MEHDLNSTELASTSLLGVRVRCPFVDYAGNTLFEGDTILHPSGQMGTIIYRADMESEPDRWLVNYGDYLESRLVLQVDDKGQAVKVPNVRVKADGSQRLTVAP